MKRKIIERFSTEEEIEGYEALADEAVEELMGLRGTMPVAQASESSNNGEGNMPAAQASESPNEECPEDRGKTTHINKNEVVAAGNVTGLVGNGEVIEDQAVEGQAEGSTCEKGLEKGVVVGDTFAAESKAVEDNTDMPEEPEATLEPKVDQDRLAECNRSRANGSFIANGVCATRRGFQEACRRETCVNKNEFDVSEACRTTTCVNKNGRNVVGGLDEKNKPGSPPRESGAVKIVRETMVASRGL